MDEKVFKDGHYRIEGAEMVETIYNGKTAVISFESPCKKYDKIEIFLMRMKSRGYLELYGIKKNTYFVMSII